MYLKSLLYICIRKLKQSITTKKKVMKARFETLKEKASDLTFVELSNEVSEIVKEIISTDNSLISVDKGWSSYGTWKSAGFANVYRFGDELAQIITKSLSGRVTHDEDKQFEVADFEERLHDDIFEFLY